MIYSKNPKILQLELSSMCNALCLGCQRVDDTTYNTVHPSIPKKEMISVETLEKLVTSSAMSTVDKIEFCGTIDEPLMHPEFMDIIDVLYNTNPKLEIVIGKSNKADAKIAGITPAVLIFKGKWDDSPPYILFPTCLFG